MNAESPFYYKSNRLQQLRGFYYTVQLGSMSKAAQKMGLQPSSISMQIKSLERDLETTFFKKTGVKVIPNDNGRLLYDIIMPHIEGIDKLPEHFSKRLQEHQSEYIKISANHASIRYLLAPLIQSCKNQFPNIDVEVLLRDREEGFDLLRHNKTQVYLGAIDDVPDDFDFHLIAECEVILIARKDHPLILDQSSTIANLTKYPTLRSSNPKFYTIPFFEEFLDAHNVNSYAHIEGTDWEIQKAFVRQSDAFVIVSKLCYDPQHDQDLGFISLKQFIPNIKYGFVVKANQALSPPVKALLKSQI